MEITDNLQNYIYQIHNSEGTTTGPKEVLNYISNNKTTLFWGMYRDTDIFLCSNHKGKKLVYWHYNDCNPIHNTRSKNVYKIKNLKDVIHLCNNDSAEFLNYYDIEYKVILPSYKDCFDYKLLSKYSLFDINYYFKNNFSYQKKLYYNLILKNDILINIITNNKSINFLFYKNKFFYNKNEISELESNNNFKIYKNFNKNIFEIFFNNILIYKINFYIDIKLININNNYDVSINYPLSIDDFNDTHFENLNYFLKSTNFKSNKGKKQYNICHTDSSNHNYFHYDLDDIILKKNINYIFCETKLNFNLGFTRNLFNFLNLSDKIIFCDIDIPLTNSVLNKIIKELDNNGVVSPYKNNIYYTTSSQKKLWMEKYKLNNIDYEKFVKDINKIKNKKNLFSISGGITGYNKQIINFLGGYSELNKYGSEDRYMDVNLLHYFKNEICILNNNLFHLYHTPSNLKNQNEEANKIYYKYYKCKYDKNSKNDIHENCKHNTKYLDNLRLQRQSTNFNLNLLSSEYDINNLDLRESILTDNYLNLYYGNIIISEKGNYFVIDTDIKLKNISNNFNVLNLETFEIFKNCNFISNKLYFDNNLCINVLKIMSKNDYRNKYLNENEYIVSNLTNINKLNLNDIIKLNLNDIYFLI